MDTAAWIPFRWPVAWNETGFDVLRGSPVNCIIFEESAPAGLRDIAKQKGFAIPDNVEFAPLGDQLWKSSKPVLAISNAIWPGIRATKKKADEAAEAGPTGAPWVNANGWTLQMAKALVPRKTLWLASEPPNDQILTAESYQLAAAEAGSRGARWIIRLDEKLAAGLLKGDTDARKTWERIGTSVNLFQRHAAWSTFDAVAPLAVISDFAGDNEFLGGEILNLADRRNLLYRIVPKSTAVAADLHGFAALLYVDAAAPEPALAEKMAAFARDGGLVVAPAKCAPKGAGSLECPVPGFLLHASGKGKIATPDGDWEDPYQIAAATHALMSRRADPLRLYNTGTTGCQFSRARNGKTAVAHLINYTARPEANPVTLGIQRPAASARLYTFEKPEGAVVQVVKRKYGVEFPLPPFPVWAAVEMEG